MSVEFQAKKLIKRVRNIANLPLRAVIDGDLVTNCSNFMESCQKRGGHENRENLSNEAKILPICPRSKVLFS